MWAGLPVLTHLGHSFAGRVAVSLLGAVDLLETITRSWAEYEALALKLAAEPGVLGGLKERLARVRAVPLFDTARYCRHLKEAYITLWERARRGTPPAGFSVGER